MEDLHVSLKRLMRVAIFSFAGIGGVALYALIGGPIMMRYTPEFSANIRPVENFLSATGEAFVVVKEKLSPVDRSTIEVALASPADDLRQMREVFDASSWKAGSRSVVFLKNKNEASVGKVLEHFSGGAHGFDGIGAGSFVYTKNTDRYFGQVEASVTDRDHAYVSLVVNEKVALTSMLLVVHPDMSSDEAAHYASAPSILVIHDDGTQERTLKNGNGEEILDWKLSKTKLTISSGD